MSATIPTSHAALIKYSFHPICSSARGVMSSKIVLAVVHINTGASG